MVYTRKIKKEVCIMKTVLLTNEYTGRPLEIIREALPQGFEIVFPQSQTQNALEEAIAGADYLLAGGRLKITADVLENAKRLSMIQRSGVGLDSIDLDAVKKSGIPLYVNKGVNAQSVAEHTLLLILASLRRLTVIDRNTRSGIWKKQEQGVTTHELCGKTVGIVGMGSVAKTLVSLLAPFRVKILYSDIERADEEFEKAYGLEYVPFIDLLLNSDIISLNCALTPQTQWLLNTQQLWHAKTGVIIVNTARGGLINMPALYHALVNGQVGFAALDVHETEPLPENYPLASLENVILTPHIAGVTADSFAAMMQDAFRNIVCFDEGRLDEIEQYRYI